MHNLIEAVTPLKGKNGGVSIEQVKEMLKKGTTLSELTNLLLKKTHSKFNPFAYTAEDNVFTFKDEEKQAVIRALTLAKIKANIISVSAYTPPLAKNKAASVSVVADAPAKKSSFACEKKSTRYFS